MKNVPIHQINVNTVNGRIGVLSQHIPIIEQIAPGYVEIIGEKEKKKYFGTF